LSFYRLKAAECSRAANQTSDLDKKERLAHEAQAWLRIAERDDQLREKERLDGNPPDPGHFGTTAGQTP